MKKDIASIKEAVDSLDPEALSPEEVDILGTMAPKEDEVSVYVHMYLQYTCIVSATCMHVLKYIYTVHTVRM